MGLEILPGTENGYRYEEHKSSGLTASFGKGNAFVGMERKKSELEEHKSRTVGTVLNAHSEGIALAGDTIVSVGSKFNAGTPGITLISKNGITIKDGQDISFMNQSSETSRTGLYTNANGKRLSASAGLERAYTANIGSQVVVNSNRNVFVTDGEINMYTENGDILLQGDFGSRNNVIAYSQNGKVYIRDSRREVSTNSHNVSARVALGVGIDASGIKDTLKSYKDYLKAVKEIGNIGRVGKFIREVASGKDILESLEGKEDTINALNTYLKGPNSGGVSAGIGVGIDIESGKSVTHSIENITTNIRTGGSTILKGKGLDFYGGVLKADGDVILDSPKINIQASKNTYTSIGKGISWNRWI